MIIRLIVALIMHVYVQSDWNRILRSVRAYDFFPGPEVEGDDSRVVVTFENGKQHDGDVKEQKSRGQP